MNFLGHSLLAFGDAQLLTGQFAGDFVRGRALAGWTPREAEGIRLHRFIDAFTDSHPEVVALRRRFAPERRRFAGIALDVELDHQLAIAWQRHGTPLSGGSLAEHARYVDHTLAAAHRSGWPRGLDRLQRALAREQLFERWATREGVSQTLARIASRSPRLAPLTQTAIDLAELGSELATVFDRLWPDVVAASRERIRSATAGTSGRSSEQPKR